MSIKTIILAMINPWQHAFITDNFFLRINGTAMTDFLKFGDLYISTSQIISVQYLTTDTVEIRTSDSRVHLIQGTAATNFKPYIDGYSTVFALS